ncbi:MAG: helix-turn-helix transcriptional regulator [Oscillospiraceae bacterium]|nr:helix-turn-helix transcriptional regulator [Oscillospiraceae bacterium]
MAIFGNMVKKILIDKGMSQKELASLCGISANNLNNILNRDNVTLDKMKQISEALDCELTIELKPK